MSLPTLNYKILRLIGGLLLVTSIAILLLVWMAINGYAKQQVERELQVGKHVLSQVLKSREEQLLNSAQVLTADFGFKQAVATRDKSTIESVLLNHGERISADLMMLLSLKGEPLASTSSTQKNDESNYVKELKQAVISKEKIILLNLDDRLIQCILLTVDAPKPIAVALVGFEVNKELVESLKATTNLDVTIQVLKQGKLKNIVSSLEFLNDFSSELLNHDEQDFIKLIFSGNTRVASQSIKLSQSENLEVIGVLSVDLKKILSEFYKLQIEIIVVSIVAILFALFFGAMLAKNLTKPIFRLAKMANSIAKGDYQKALDIDIKSQEINSLVSSFEAMRRDIREREKDNQYRAHHDLMTGLYNRYYINEILKLKIDAKSLKQVVAFKVIDFRGINNVFGHDSGDSCIISLANRVKKLSGCAARLDGGELLWLPEELVSQAKLFEIRKSLEETHMIDDTFIEMRLAVGVVSNFESNVFSEVLLKQASITLEHAVSQPDLYHVFSEKLELDFRFRLEMLRELEAALTSKPCDLSMFYQPKLDLKTGEVKKIEALIRWNSKKLGFVSPMVFIPIAEKAGLITQITYWVINQVIQDLSQWKTQGINVQVAINLSVHDFNDENLLGYINEKLQLAQLSSNVLSFEITESEIISEHNNAIALLTEFNQKGFSLSIDDFGTGYSSLSYLKNLPVKELKIDKSFILKLDQQMDDQRIVQTIISLARSFNLEVVAEGVENKEALQLLKDWGCDWIQGYFISKPMPFEMVAEWLGRHNAS